MDRGKFGEHGTGLSLNIVEMFLALMLQTLSYDDLVDWLPEDVIIRHGFERLNQELPIHQYLSDDARFASSRLCRSEDPEIRANARASVLSALQMANTALRCINYRPLVTANRTRGKHFLVYFRETDTSLGDPPTVMVRCRKCDYIRTDNSAYFLIRTGAYVVQRQPCSQCGGDSRSGLS